MRPSSITLVAVAVLLGTVPVSELAAQMPPPRPQPPPPPPRPVPGGDVRIKESDFFALRFPDGPAAAAEAYSSALSFASCTARLNSRAARSVLDADANSVAEGRAIRELVRHYRTCIVSRAAVPTIYMRGALAEALAKKAGAHPNSSPRAALAMTRVGWGVVPIDKGVVLDNIHVGRFIKAKPMGERTIRSSGYPIYWIARCQVMALPDEVAEVLAGRPGSSREETAAKSLYARSGACGVWGGLGKTPVLAVRSSLADALYRQVEAGPVAE